MSKFGVLFLLIGLAIGLFLGFNPATHRDLVREWNRARIGQASGSPSLTTTVVRRAGRFLRSSPKVQAEPTPVPSGTQIQAELQALWNALRQLGLNFIARFRAGKA